MSIKSNQAGRSMIEMLGVLAIVGVLSVGAIAEFGKAMYKWKAIKCAEEYNLFISEMLVYEKDWIKMKRKQGSGHLYIGPYMEQWGMVPSSWTVSGNYFSDRLGNHIIPFIRNDLGSSSFNWRVDIDFVLSQRKGKETAEFCRLVFHNVIIPNCDRIFAIRVAEKRNGSWNNGSDWYMGCQYCGDSKNCLGTLELIDIEKLCNVCSEEKQACNILTLF